MNRPAPIPDCMAVAASWARMLGLSAVAHLIDLRAEYGRETHGTTLAWPDERGPIEDWSQEALDTCAGYAVAVLAEMDRLGAPVALRRRIRRWTIDGMEILNDLAAWAATAGIGDLLRQQPPPRGGHEAPDVARRELAAARAEIAGLRAKLDILRDQRAATERAHDAALAGAREAEALRAAAVALVARLDHARDVEGTWPFDEDPLVALRALLGSGS